MKQQQQGGRGTSRQAADLGSKGGKKGGPARANKLTAQERSNIARKGANAKNKKSWYIVVGQGLNLHSNSS